MTCQDCKYFNPEKILDPDNYPHSAYRGCDLYPAIFPIADADICGSFKPKDKDASDSWDSISK